MKIQKRTSRVITLRSERGYSAANYDGSAVKHPKTLRCQFGNFYDAKKVRNTYALWERNDVALRPDQLLTLAKALNVRPEELLNPPTASNRRGGPAGKARRVFEAVSLLPRNRQQKILEVVEALVAQHANGNA